MQIKKDRVLLVGLLLKGEDRDDYLETMEELSRLASTAGAEIFTSVIQTKKKPNPATYIGKGKLIEIKRKVKKNNVTTLIFNDELSPAQARNISKITRCKIVDRTELILDIFSQHARTKQAKLQVELAQLEYNYSKLRNLWTHLSRIEGGIGFRGPGEKQIELDRREIQDKISFLKKKIEAHEKVTNTKRKRRSNFTTISLVGYTNAGKSTLFNLLTNEEVYIADKLFATLDAKTRKLYIPTGEKAVLTDTIGFIKKLPHLLISSFHSTLMEVIEADLLLHVIDISSKKLFDHIEEVHKVLNEIDAGDKEMIYVFNKIDRLKGVDHLFLKKKIMLEYPDSVFVSAKTGEGIDDLKEIISDFFRHRKKEIKLSIPAELQSLISYLYDNTEVMKDKYDVDKNQHKMKLVISRRLLPSVKKQIEKHNLKKYINN